MKPDNLIGQRFGLLTVIERRPSKNGHSNWLCKCDCGTEKEILGTNLKTGKVVSCGCYHKKLISQMKTKDLSFNKKAGWINSISFFYPMQSLTKSH